MILKGIRCPNEATTPISQFSCHEASLESGQIFMGSWLDWAKSPTAHKCGFGGGITTDSASTICLFNLDGNISVVNFSTV